MQGKLKIITTCWNAERWIETCVRSVVLQTYENWEMFIVNDNSSDKTSAILKQFSGKDKIHIVRNEDRLLKIRSFLRGIKIANPNDEDVLVFLDGDDWLPDNDVFDHLSKMYINDTVWMTWGSYIDDVGDPKVFGKYIKTKECSRFAAPPAKGWDVRRSWRYSHLKTFKYFLWKNINDDAFRKESTGDYFQQTDDLTFMYPMLEMAGPSRAKHIDRLMYVRNTFNNINNETGKTVSCEKGNSQEIRSREPYKRKTKQELVNG